MRRFWSIWTAIATTLALGTTYRSMGIIIMLQESMKHEDVLEYLEMVPNFGLSKVRPPEHAIGRTLEEIGLAGTRDRYGVTVIAIQRGREPVLLPAKDEAVMKGDILFVAGSDELLDRLRRPLRTAGTDPTGSPQ